MRQRVAAAEKVIDGQIDEVRTSATVLTAARTMASEALRSGNVTLIASAYEFGGRTAVAVKPFVGSRQTVGVHLCVDDGPVLAATAALGKVEEYPLLVCSFSCPPRPRASQLFPLH